ncbi:MAG: hypothetical protein IJR45_00820 [Firmicutes bacterium]|nr:hypothetical protein [Bacillota bacterium]MBQ9603933.1 hypothetical protein [Bacillota bacterium]
MKIICRCGNIIPDIVENVPNKAWYISDKDTSLLFDSLYDALISNEKNKDKLYIELCGKISKLSYCAYRCPECGRLYIEDEKRELKEYISR